ncbi:M20 family metallopeptidase [Arhodomonas sp. KWT2]|uniref:M20 family metallopeptidase n=1 Tax=unclassified Arhodomonas TaxID=2621637 RepID=UPI0013D86F40|nr:M20 family metallopeptidase [Arhodomonas sp. KWT]
MASMLDQARAQALVDETWEASILPALTEYIRIPAKSPHFDGDWAASGHIDAAVALAERWCREQPVEGMSVEVVRLEGRTPVLLLDIPGTAEGTVLLYGHLDKQPEMTGWDADKGPWQPVMEGDRLYGRGGADDGYAVFASLTAVRALQDQGVAHPRCVVLIETCEESGSFDLPHYIDALAGRIGEPELVICLDSGCGNYDQLWLTTSLRGMAMGDLSVEILEEGVHSGDAGGVVPDSFRLARGLLERLESAADGGILPEAFRAEIPAERQEQAEAAASVLGEGVYRKFPFVGGAGPDRDDPMELILDRTWRPALAVTGADGLPPLASAGNVLRPCTVLRLSLRLPPTVDGEAATRALKDLLERDPPNGARVHFDAAWATTGWHAPPLESWLSDAVNTASQAWFGRPAMAMGEGGTIPFMGMLGERFPQAQFLITGVLGPQSNAHGPNEFLHVPTARRLTGAVASVLAAHAAQGRVAD